MSSKTTTSGACSSSSLRNAQAISSALVADLRFTQKRADRRRRNRVGREYRELLHHLHDGPVRDPLSVGQAAAPDDTSLDRLQRLGNQPRLAHAGVAHDSHELAARLRPSARSHASASDRSSRSRPTNRDAWLRSGASSDRDEPERRHRLGLPLQGQRLQPAPPPRLRGPARASPRRSTPHPAPQPARVAPRR